MLKIYKKCCFNLGLLGSSDNLNVHEYFPKKIQKLQQSQN